MLQGTMAAAKISHNETLKQLHKSFFPVSIWNIQRLADAVRAMLTLILHHLLKCTMLSWGKKNKTTHDGSHLFLSYNCSNS